MKMTFEQFVKKNAKRITRLETELNKLFDGTRVYTAVEIQQGMFRPCDGPTFEFKAYIEKPRAWYDLANFANMTAMITQIKHDVKEARK